MNCNMDYDSLAGAGSMLGAGSVIIMDETTCMVQMLERIAYFYWRGVLRPVYPVSGGNRLAVPHAQAHPQRPRTNE